MADQESSYASSSRWELNMGPLKDDPMGCHDVASSKGAHAHLAARQWLEVHTL